MRYKHSRAMALLNRLKIYLAVTFIVAVCSVGVLLHYSTWRKVPTMPTKRVSTQEQRIVNTNTTEVSSESTLPAKHSTENSIKLPDPIDNLILRELDNQKYATSGSPQDQSGGQVLPASEDSEEKTDQVSTEEPATESVQLCPDDKSLLVGRLAVNSMVTNMEALNKDFSAEFGGWVLKGGAWRPTDCKARIKMALIIPFRNRYEQLSIFARHMHPMLKRQNLDYRIVVVEQAGNTPFNRAMLFNIGYKEALKFDDFECFIFHDVDLIPEDDRNMYSCPTSPRHMSVAVDKFNYHLPYATIFGGAGAFTRKHFEDVNGFSNVFWGWGGEDDDLYKRIKAKNYKLTRPSLEVGRYSMIKIHHKQSGKADPERFNKLRNSEQRMGRDGLSSLKYNLLDVVEAPLYTMVKVHIDKSMTPS